MVYDGVCMVVYVLLLHWCMVGCMTVLVLFVLHWCMVVYGGLYGGVACDAFAHAFMLPQQRPLQQLPHAMSALPKRWKCGVRSVTLIVNPASTTP